MERDPEIFYIADTHFCHPAIAAARGFADTEAHNEALLRDWQERVKPNDQVYILGDLFAYRWERQILNALTGRLILICGNHEDRHWLRHFPAPEQFFERVAPHKLTVLDQGRSVSLCHTPEPELGPSMPEDYLLHGHLHTQSPRRDDWLRVCLNPHTLNVGADIGRCALGRWAPATLDEWLLAKTVWERRLHTISSEKFHGMANEPGG